MRRGGCGRGRPCARTWAIAVAALGMMVGRAAAQSVPPIIVPFEIANQQIFGGKFDDSIRGFLDFERQGIFQFSAVFVGQEVFARTNRAFDDFGRQAGSASDEIPIPSGSMSIAYEYDPKLETFVQSQRPFAPALSLNARTDGRGILTIGSSFSYLDYKTFDGQDRDGVVLTSLPAFAFETADIVDVVSFEFELKQRVYALSVQYGLLDRLDVGVFVPVVDQSFRAVVLDQFAARLPDGSYERCCDPNGNSLPPVRRVNRAFYDVFPGQAPIVGYSLHSDETGIGDMVLRSKAFLGSLGPVDAGVAANLSLPTGDEDNLMGLGSVRFDPRLLVSTANSLFALHTGLGVHVDFDDSDRDRYDYSVGGEFRISSWATLLFDQVGRIEWSGEGKVKKFDAIPGIKVNPYRSFIVGFNAIVPLNREGLRTDFTPDATVEISTAF